MTPPVRVGIVGAGRWGEQHARLFSSREDTELVAVVGRDPARTEARAAKYATVGFTDLDAMLDSARPDLVTVCLPNESHFDITRHLLTHGVNLLVEKPLVFSLREADELLATAEASGSFFAINFNHRYAEPFLRAKAAIVDGRLGELVLLTWRFGGEANLGESEHANLIETQCHGFDMLEHLGGPIASVAALMTDKTYGALSTVAIALEFTSAAVGSLVGSYDSSYAYPDSQLVEVNGTLGRLVVHDTVRRLEMSEAGSEVRSVWEAGYFNDEGRSFQLTFDRHMDDLLHRFVHHQEPPVHARAGRRALQLAHACIESWERGTRVPTP